MTALRRIWLTMELAKQRYLARHCAGQCEVMACHKRCAWHIVRELRGPR